MADTLKLMAVLAHPDDESLGADGILAKYAAEGIETFLVTATRGERGWFGDEREYPGLEALGSPRYPWRRFAGVHRWRAGPGPPGRGRRKNRRTPAARQA